MTSHLQAVTFLYLAEGKLRSSSLLVVMSRRSTFRWRFGLEECSLLSKPEVHLHYNKLDSRLDLDFSSFPVNVFFLLQDRIQGTTWHLVVTTP